MKKDKLLYTLHIKHKTISHDEILTLNKYRVNESLLKILISAIRIKIGVITGVDYYKDLKDKNWLNNMVWYE